MARTTRAETVFKDRADAGRTLAAALTEYGPDALVLALPRGGVPVAFEVTGALGATLEVFVVRKLGAPGQPELALGAIAPGGVQVLNDHIVRALRISEREVAAVVKREERELGRRERLYRGERPYPTIEGRTVILVDDGLATGATMRVAVKALRAQNPERLVVAVPVGAPDTCERLRLEADVVVCAATPEPFYGVGQWYGAFPQIGDGEVQELLSRARRGRP